MATSHLRPLSLSLPQAVATLQQPYPQPEPFHQAASYRAFQASLSRLWLSEGIPYAFRSRPAVYEAIREWLAERLDVHAKDITIIGSARIGWSLSPQHPWRPFSPTSDLDLSVISSSLLTRLSTVFDTWAHDFESGALHGFPDGLTRFWPGNVAFGRRNIPRGFMDADKVPRLPQYPFSQLCGQSMYLIQRAVSSSDLGIQPKKVTIRVYRDWAVFIRRLQMVLPELPPPASAA